MRRSQIVDEFKAGKFTFRIMVMDANENDPRAMHGVWYRVIVRISNHRWRNIEGSFETEMGAVRHAFKCLCNILETKKLQWPFISGKDIHL